MSYNTISHIIKTTSLAITFLTTVNAAGMNEDSKHILNPNADDWKPNNTQNHDTFTPHLTVTESESNPSTWRGTTYFTQDALSAQYDLYSYNENNAQSIYPAGSLSSTTCTETLFSAQDTLTLTNMAHAYIDLGSLQDGNQAIYYNNALALATLINDTELMIQAYIGLGDARDGQDYGVTHYKMALTLLGEHGNQRLKARIHLSISIALSKFNITD